MRADSERKKLCRAAVGKHLFFGHRRPDAQFATKERARTVGCPNEDGERRVKKLSRYYLGKRDHGMHSSPVSNTA